MLHSLNQPHGAGVDHEGTGQQEDNQALSKDEDVAPEPFLRTTPAWGRAEKGALANGRWATQSVARWPPGLAERTRMLGAL